MQPGIAQHKLESSTPPGLNAARACQRPQFHASSLNGKLNQRHGAEFKPGARLHKAS